jgi:hypothetical protein
MKTKILILILSVISIYLKANDYKTYFYDNDNNDDNDEIRTIFKPGTTGGYGSIFLQYSTLANQDAVYIGGRGGWIIGHGFSIGFGGTGYFNKFINYSTDTVHNISGGHGGLYIEPIFLPRFPVNLAIPIFLGFGSVSQFEYLFSDFDNEYYRGYPLKSDTYFIIEPGAEIQFNLLKTVRFSIGISLPYTTKIDLEPYLSKYPFNNIKYNVRLTFGKF